jgi:hypothetical protein
VSLRHRYLVAGPFLVLVLVALVGGWINTADVHARVVDDLTDKGIKDARITHGSRVTTTDPDGAFALTNVPRTSKYQIDASGYLRTSAPMSAEEIRMRPLSVTIYAYDDTKTPDDRVKNPQARDPENTRIVASGNESGQIIVAPHPGKDAKLLLCADGSDRIVITVQGVLMQVGMHPGSAGCAPLPSPSPAPGASPSAPRPSPSASPSASPAASPTASP